MNKQQAFEYIRKKIGFVPYITIFEIYDNEEEIPQELINLSIAPIKPRENFIITSSQVADNLNKILNSYK